MKTAIVTGANGFVGSALVKELSDNGVQVFAVVRNENSDVSAIQGLTGVTVVYCPMENLLETLPGTVPQGADVFYHLAWSGSTGPDRGNYDLQLKNVHWTLDAVHAAHRLGCKRFVGAGTLAELDVNAYTPINGSTPNAVSCYGAAKIAAHYMSKAECGRLGVEHLWAYLSNTYGEGNYTSNFINFASKVMITGQEPNFTAGEQPYDFVHVSDTAQGLFCIGNKGRTNYAYYIGSTRPGKLKTFIFSLRDVIDPSISLNLGAIPFNGIAQPESVFDCTALVEDTGYSPRISFREGIQKTIPWIRQQIKEGKL